MAGVPDWYDPDGGTGSEVDTRLAEAFCLIVLVSKDSMRSRTVRRDIETARARGLPIFPFRVDDTRFTSYFKTVIVPHLRHALSDEGGLSRFAQDIKQRFKHRCPVISVMNLKGGVGKTTVSAQVFGTWQARTGGRILLIDFDPQYNLTQTFFPTDHADASSALDRSVISLFERSRLRESGAPSPAEDWTSLQTKPFNAITRERLMHPLLTMPEARGWLDLVTGQFEISKYAFVQNADDLDAVKTNFLRVIDTYRGLYDLIIFDTNPNATFLTRCALEAADRVLAPIHPDIYSLRGIRLLNRVIHEQVSEAARPELSVLFNAVTRSEQSTFEADARTGVHNQIAGFDLDQALLKAALPRSRHMAVRAPTEETPPWKSLLVHHGRGGGLKPMRESLKNISLELEELITQSI